MWGIRHKGQQEEKRFAQVKISRLSDEARADLVRQTNNIPEILECYTVFGEMDVMRKFR